jgi:hypothetical protein
MKKVFDQTVRDLYVLHLTFLPNSHPSCPIPGSSVVLIWLPSSPLQEKRGEQEGPQGAWHRTKGERSRSHVSSMLLPNSLDCHYSQAGIKHDLNMCLLSMT